MITVRVGHDDFDLGNEYARLIAGDTAHGAVASFVGRVRGDEHLVALTLEHYPGMTEKALTRIASDACARWPLGGVTIVHRVGRLEAGAQIVLVLTQSAHRRAAYEANEYIMDYLKTEAPFWKFEETSSGGHWVDARESDDAAKQRWEQPC
ncbi:molybdenum cofactor biosynthesis protein MoaE [Chitinibacteraceae bacterium HSL-7]